MEDQPNNILSVAVAPNEVVAVAPNEVIDAESSLHAEVDPLDELKDLDFLLEDIEDKIAPLALLVSH